MTVNRRGPFLVTNTWSSLDTRPKRFLLLFVYLLFSIQKFTVSRPISFYLLVHYFKASSKLRMLVHVTRNSR